MRKQNRSTTEALFNKNHFLSSASEEDEPDGQSGTSKRGRDMALRRAKIKAVATSVINGKKEGSASRLPLYG